jgi:sugar phosphate isomerase/epimerase
MKRPTIGLMLCSLLLAASAAPAAVGTGPSFKGPVGLQLYSLRGEFIRNVPATLEKVKGYGVRWVELAGTYNLPPAKFRQMLDQNQLKAVSGHFPFERYRDDIETVAAEAKALGLEYAGCAWIPHQGDFDEAQCRTAVAVFNKAGEALARHGIKFFYHTHGYEFRKHGNGTLMDLLIAETHPKHVAFEMDVFWVVHPGHDPAAWLRKYPTRWALLHVKDMKKGLATGVLTGKADVTNDVTVGTGQMNWPDILKAAAEVGVKYYFIEDESPTAAEQIPQSLKFLETVRF